MVLETVIENMKTRIINFNTLTSNNDKQDKIHGLISNFLELNLWNSEEVVVHWRAAKEKLKEISKIFLHEISINDFQDFSNPAKAEFEVYRK